MYLSKLRSADHFLLALAGALLLPLGALAQEVAAPTTTLSQKDVEEMIVTGSRIPEPNLVSTSPIQVVGAEAIKLTGKNDIADILQLLPQNFNNSLGQDLGNTTSGLTTPGGVATADLRGLGPNRTLVLVNGRRLGAGSPNTAITSPAPDLDQIPTRLIERVDVVTGGASATYGSDAIAGVINFIMKKNFEGLEIDGSYGFNQHDNHNSYMQQTARDFGVEPETGNSTDGYNKSVSVVGGVNSNDDRGNFTVYFGYQDQNPVLSGDRDFGACQLNKDTVGENVPTGTASCGGSANSNYFDPASGPFANDANAFFNVAGDQFEPWGSQDVNPPSEFNSQAPISISREYERYTAGFLGHYDINDYVKPYAEFFYMNDRTSVTTAPAALFIGSNPLSSDGTYQVNCSSPLLSAQQRNILCTPQEILDDTAVPGSALASLDIGRRNAEGLGRSTDFEHSSYRAVLGATGDIATGWSYDLYGQYYYTTLYTANNNYLDYQKIENALQVTDSVNGPVCLSGGSCVPYNIFTEGGVSQAQVDYLYAFGTAYGTTKLGTYHVDVTGDLGEYGVRLPTADDGVAINVGWEKRNERTEYQPDQAQLSGLLAGFGGASTPIDKGIQVDELFAETRIPLVQGRPGIEELAVDAGYRYSDYSTVGGENTYKFGVQYSPVAGYRLRGSYQRAIRAPGIIELYSPQLVGQIQIGTDPCARTLDDNNAVVPAAATLQECLNTVRPDQAAAFTAAYGNGGTTNTIPQGVASQLTQLQGGNTELVPEQADTYSFGLSLTPDLVPNFTGSIDYFNIKLENIIDTLPASVILNDCPSTGNAVLCAQLVRQPVNFGLNGASVENGGYIVQTNRNIASAQVSGIDLQAAYQLEMSPAVGSVTFALAGTYMINNNTTSYAGATTYDCAGLFGATCQTVNPDWRHVLRTSWQTPWDVTAALTWRYFDRVHQDNNDPNPVLNNAVYNGYDSFNDHIRSYSYWDLAATYTPLENLEVRAGINNIGDTDPPVISSEIAAGGSANTYETYDMYGRQIFLGFTLKL